MPNELATLGVTRPDSFDESKDYAEVIVRAGSGDEWTGDFDFNDMQRFLRHDFAVVMRMLVHEGAILAEVGGGTVGEPIAGVALGGDTLRSGGTYRGIESQVYTVEIPTPGAVGVATYTWRSSGPDNLFEVGTPRPITKIAPSAAAAIDATVGSPTFGQIKAEYAHPLGTLGIVIAFVNATGSVNASSWVVVATAGERPPSVTKNSSPGNDTIRCYESIVIVQGSPRRVREAAFTVPAATTGTLVIYGEWTRRIVTSDEDATLTDDESDTPLSPRMQWRVMYRTSDTSALSLGPSEVERRVFPMYLWNRATDVVERVIKRPFLIDIAKTQGALTGDRLVNIQQNVLLEGEFARRDHGAHGSYVRWPLAPAARARLSTNAAPLGKILAALEPFGVSVEGILVEREATAEAPLEQAIDQATQFLTVTGEQQVYKTAAGGFYLNKAVGERAFPIRTIDLVRAHVAVGTGTAGTGTGWEQLNKVSDNVLNFDAVDVLEVNSLANGSGTVYAEGTGANQWQLVGNNITWPGGGGPAGNYFVKYIANRTLAEYNGSSGDYTLNADGFLTFAPSGLDPINDGIVTVDYTAYLPRVDAIVIRPSGDWVWVKGIAAEIPLLPALPGLTLPYVRVELGAGPSGAVRFEPFDNDAVHMTTLNRVVRAVRELTQNDVYQDLFNQVRAGMPASANLLDIVAEAFATLDVADVTYNDGSVAFNALVDVGANELTLPFTQATYVRERETAGLPAGETAVRVGADFYTLPFTHELALQNDAYSRLSNINPYASFTPENPSFVLTPDRDFFVDTANQNVSTVAQIRVVQASAQDLINGQERMRLARDFRARNGRNAGRGDVLGVLESEIVGQTIQTTAALYMRQITLTVRGVLCLASEKIRAKFDGKDVALTAVPATGTTQGTGPDAHAVITSPAAGDLSARGGSFQATFPIPHPTEGANRGVPVGTRQLVLYGNRGNPAATWNSASPATGGYAVLGSVPFTSDGQVRTTITEERILEIIGDPVAQSVVFPAARMISRVEIPFATRGPNGDAPVIFELRGTILAGNASTPSTTVLAQIVRDAAAINAGPASLNSFEPSDPVLAFPNQFRSMVLRSASNAYHVYVAGLAGTNLASGGPIVSQAIPDGIFMDSANNVDWTFHQGEDLRCKVYVAKCSASTALLYFGRITHTDVTGFTVNVDQVIPDGTEIAWECSVDGLALNSGSKVWRPFVPFIPVEVPPNADGSVPDTLDIRATLRTTSLYVMPAVHRRNFSVHVTTNGTTAVYVSKSKLLTADADAIAGQIDLLLNPAVHTPSLYVSVDDGTTWRAATLSAAPADGGGVIADGFTRYTYSFDAFTTESIKRRLRTRVELVTTNKALRPRARALGAYSVPV